MFCCKKKLCTWLIYIYIKLKIVISFVCLFVCLCQISYLRLMFPGKAGLPSKFNLLTKLIVYFLDLTCQPLGKVFIEPKFLLKGAADASFPVSGLSCSGNINIILILCLYFVFAKIQSLRVTTIKKKYIFGKHIL